jgi:hypothetical protein
MRDTLSPVLSTGGRHLFNHIELQRRLDLAWLEELVADIEANGIEDVRDPAALAPR